MITFKEAKEIAIKIDANAKCNYKNKRGWHFMNPADEFSVSDPGFAVSKEDGKVYRGFAANEFIYGLNEEKNSGSYHYVEPVDYFPEEIRKECKLGEYAEKETE